MTTLVIVEQCLAGGNLAAEDFGGVEAGFGLEVDVRALRELVHDSVPVPPGEARDSVTS